MVQAEVCYYSYRLGRSRRIKVREHSWLGEGVNQAVHNPTLGVHNGGHSLKKQEGVASDLKALGAPQALVYGLSKDVNGRDTHVIAWLQDGRAVVGLVEHPQKPSGRFKVRIAKVK